MQFRAGVLYVVLFLVVAAGAYGVAATAEAPQVTVDESNADEQLSQGDPFEVDGQEFNVTELSGGSGTVQHVNESVTTSVSWSDGDAVEIAEGEEYTVSINQPDEGDGDNESQPESFTLRESVDEDEYETVEREDGLYVVLEENDTTELVHVDEFDELDSQTYETGDTVEFYDGEAGETVEGTVAEITGDGVTVEYEGQEVEEFSLSHEETVTLNDQEYVVYFPSDDQAYLSSDVSGFETQQEDVSEFNERVRGLWWVITLSILSAVVIGALAYLPVRN